MKSPTSLPLTIALIILLIVGACSMLQSDAPQREKRELIVFCDSDYCTTAAGAFWAKQDSLDAARFFGDASDEALPADEGM